MARTGEEGMVTCLGGKGIRFVGDVQGAGPVVCAGDVEGTIAVDGLVQISPEARVRGNLRAREADIAGAVEGDVITCGRLTLRATARLRGDVMAGELVVEAGAVLQGQVRTASGAAGVAPWASAAAGTLAAGGTPSSGSALADRLPHG